MLLHGIHTLLAQDPLYAFDRVSVPVQQVAHAEQQLHILGPVEAAPATALHRPDMRELDLPEAQYVFRHAQFLATSLIVRNAPADLFIVYPTSVPRLRRPADYDEVNKLFAIPPRFAASNRC